MALLCTAPQQVTKRTYAARAPHKKFIKDMAGQGERVGLRLAVRCEAKARAEARAGVRFRV